MLSAPQDLKAGLAIANIDHMRKDPDTSITLVKPIQKCPISTMEEMMTTAHNIRLSLLDGTVAGIMPEVQDVITMLILITLLREGV